MDADYENLQLQQKEDATYEDLNTRPRPPSKAGKRWVGVCAGFLFAVLALLSIAALLYLYLSNTVERKQLVNDYNQLLDNLTRGDQSLNNLTRERDQLLDSNNKLTIERDQSLDRINNLTRERDQSLDRINNLTRERDQSRDRNNQLTRERDQSLDSINNLTRERDDLKMRLCDSPGWQKFDRGCYYISNETKNWNASRQWCRDRNSDLIVIKSKETQVFVVSFEKRVWLGLTDRETEGSFQWVDGTPLTTPTYPVWRSGQPDNHEDAEDCVEYYDGSEPDVHGKGWNDLPCSDYYNYWICERVVG